MPGQPVAASARDDAQCCALMHQTTCHFVHSAVTAHSHHHISAVCHSLTGKLCSMTTVVSVCNVHIKALVTQILRYESNDAFLVCRTRNGVDDKKY